jgi:hypothetical protein
MTSFPEPATLDAFDLALGTAKGLWSNAGNMTLGRPRFLQIPALLWLLCLAALLPPACSAQSVAPERYQIFGGYSYLSNSLNGVSGHRQPLNGWDFAFAIPPWHDLRFKLAAFGYRGTNQNAFEHPYFVMGGGQYGKYFGREGAFVEALGGVGNVNTNWGANGARGDTASFSAILGGGLDTPIARHFAVRVEGDYLYAYFKQNLRFNNTPTYVPGLPTNFARFSAGLVWRF